MTKKPVQAYRKSRFEILEDRRLLTGTWTNVTNPVPNADDAQMSLLLPNGDLMVHGAVGASRSGSANWYLLAPDATGGYQNGTWTQTGSMNVSRLYFGSDVLPNGNVFVVGGEYSSAGGDTNTAEIYNMATGVWTSVAPDPQANVGDEETALLPDGSVLVANGSNNGTEIYNPATNTWSTGGTKVRNDPSSEECWVQLPNGDILSYDLYATLQDNQFEAELYNPTTNSWSDASGATSTLPFLTDGPEATEEGAAVMLPDGKALFNGENGYTAYYDTSTNLWSQGPTMPVVTINGVATQLTMGDAPAAVLPDGDALESLSPQYTPGNFPAPTYIYDLNPATGVYTNVTPPSSVINLSQDNSSDTDFLVLPTGQILLNDDVASLALYTPGGSPAAAWRPQINSFVNNGDGSYTLTGTQLNGLDEGAAYGDDEQMATNYPIVRVTDSVTGNVYYATTSNWSSVGVATGSTPETVDVVLPAALGADPFSMVVIANGISSAPVAGPITTPVVTPSGTPSTFVVGGAAVAVDSGVTVVAGGVELTGASVTISNDQPGDALNFSNQSGITGSYAGGVLTLSGSATPAQYQAALQSVTFSTTGASTTTRAITIVASDAALQSNTAAESVDVTLGPLVTASGTTNTFSLGTPPVAVDSGVTIAYYQENLTGATVTIGNVQSGDTLNFTNQGGISGSYSAGVLTLSGSATAAQYQAALQSVTFSTTSLNTTTRSLSIVALDGAMNSNSAAESVNVTIAAPVVTPSGATNTYTVTGPAVAVDAGLTVTSNDTDLTGATVTIAGTQAGDTLHFTNQNGITGSYASRVLTLSGSATPAQYQAALQSVTFSTTSTSATTRGITIVALDSNDTGDTPSYGAAESLNVSLSPAVTPSGSVNTFTVGGSAVVVDSGVTVTTTGTNLSGATVTINNYQSGDALNYTTIDTITGSYSAGVLTLTGTRSAANYQAALRTVTFSTTSTNPTTRSLSIVGINSHGDSSPAAESVNVAGGTFSPPPTVTTSGSTGQTFTVGGSVATVDSGLTVTSADTDITGASMQITAGTYQSGDVLNFTNASGITGTYSAGLLTLTGSATPAQYQAALQSVTFQTSSLNQTTRSISVVADDSGASPTTSNTGTDTVNVAIAAPTVTTSGSTGQTFTVGGSAVAVDSGVTVTSTDTDITGASMQITNFQTGDTLNFTNQNGISGTYASGLLTLSGSATPAQYTTALQSVTFQTSSLNQTTRTISVIADDSGATPTTSNTGNDTVNVAVAPPVVTNGGQSVKNATAGQTVTADSVVTVSSFDTDVTGAVVSISGNFQTGDAFQFTAQNGITISSNTGGVLTLTGSATPAQYQTALRSITYSSTSTSTLTRTVSFVVKDSNDTGNVNSNTATTTIAVSAPVAISQLYVNGTGWAAEDTYMGAHDYVTGTNNYGFTTAQNIPYGSSTLGFALVTGANQLKPLPWSTMNEIDIQFSGALGATPAASSFKITGGTGGAGHAAAAPSVTSVTSLGGNAYQLSLSGSLGYNNFIISVASTGTVFGPAVTDANGAGISGSWTNSSSTFPSGNGLAGSAFNFLVEVLPGNTVQSGTVNSQSSAKVALLLNDKTTGASSINYVPFVDVNANGTINTQDSAVIATNLNFKSSNITNPSNPAGGLAGSGFTALALGVQESGQTSSSSTPAVSNVSSPSVSPSVTPSVSTGSGSGSAGSSGGSTSTTSGHGRHAFAATDAAVSDFDLADLWA